MTELRSRPDVVCTIGAFDGVHRGHKALLREVVERARALGCQSLAVTFDPHPDLVLYPDRHLTELSDRDTKLRLMRELGIDHLRVFEFTRELSMLRPEEFIGQLESTHKLAELWVGSDFALGRGRSGTIAALAEIGGSQGFALHVVPPVKIGNEIISSTYIRTLLTQGDVGRAAELLGHRYRVSGPIVHGAARGRTIDFPTANVQVRATRALPGDGVYAALARLEGEPLACVVNLGSRPTFDEHDRTVEVHILEFDLDLYDRRLEVDFVARLREVKRFSSVDELKLQIGRDVEKARQLPALADVLPPADRRSSTQRSAQQESVEQGS
jgi:riboflavin kinase/FMN adenylyltransferase